MSRRIAIVTDSTADLPTALLAARSISVVPLTVTLDGHSYLDGVDITADAFYTLLARSSGSATTSQPSPGRFADAYRGLLEDHDEVLSLHISERLSGTWAAAVQGAELAGAERIEVVDTGLVSMPLGLMVLAAAAAREGAESAAEVVERIRPALEATRVYFMVATLEHLRRGGRIGAAGALLGSVLQLKPVLTIRRGEVTPLERIRTQERALSRIIELAREVDRGHGLCAIVGHAANPEDAARVAGALAPVADTLVVQALGPVVGAHAGPGTVGVGLYPGELLPLGIRELGSEVSPTGAR